MTYVNYGGVLLPRPCKHRRICGIPNLSKFVPDGIEDFSSVPSVVMTLDEFETIRLIDYESMTQEQCAAQMNVARTTVQAIYNSARFKLSQCLVEERPLHIEGGNYIICSGNEHDCTCPHKYCYKNNTTISKKSEETEMRIAVTYENGNIFQHFGHTEQFKIYDIENNAVVKSEVKNTMGAGHGALAGFLKDNDVDVLICGGIGGGAKQALSEAGIKLYGGVFGNADTAVDSLLNNSLSFNPDVHCNHHDHEHGEGHTCGNHGCKH